MASSSPPPPASLKRRRLLKWTAVTLGSVVLVVVLFHRPLLRWGVAFGGKKAAAAAGITLRWNVSGSVTGDLAVDAVELTGGPESPVVSGKIAHATLDYDVWAFEGGGAAGFGRVLQSVSVRDLDLSLDLTKPRPPSKPKPPKPAGRPAFPLITIPRIEIERATVRMKMANGTLAVERFSLLLDPAAPGQITVKRLALPGRPDLVDARGKTSATAHSLTLEQVSLWPGIALETLGVDLSGLPGGAIPVKVEATQDGARVAAEATVSPFDPGIPVKGAIAITDFPDTILRRWNVPMGPVGWTARRLDADVDGPVLRPDLLDVKLTLTGETITGPGFTVDAASARADLRGGTFTLEELVARRGPNTVTATGTARPPDKWARVVKSDGAAALTMSAPDLAQSLPPAAGVNAAVEGQGTFAFSQGRIVNASVEHTAKNLVVRGIPAESAKIVAKLDNGTVRVETLDLIVDDANQLAAKGELGLGGERPFSIEWNLHSTDLTSVRRALKRDEKLWPTSGRVAANGVVAGSLALLRDKRWQEMTGRVSLQAEEVKLKTAALRSLRIDAVLDQGVADIRQAELMLDEKNIVSLTGSARGLEEGLPFTADASVRLPEAAKLSAWAEEFGGPKVLGGSVLANVRAEGRVENPRISGSGKVTVDALRLTGVPEPLGLRASVLMEGENITVPELLATAGPWRVSGAARRENGVLTVTNLDARIREEKLVTGSLIAPLGGGGKGPGGLRVDEPLALDLKVDALDTDRLAKALGQKWPAAGVVTAAVKAGGTFRDLTLTTDLAAKRVRAATGEARKLEPASADLHATLAAGVLKLTGQAVQPPLRPLTLSAEMPLNPAEVAADPRSVLRRKIQAMANLPESDLAFLTKLVPALREIRGTASLDLTLAGTLADPDPRGRVEVKASEVVTAGKGSQTIRDLLIDLRADERRVNVAAARVMLAGGTLELRGHLDIQKPADPVLDLRVLANEILVLRDDAVSARANADVTVRGPLTGAAVRGQVAAVRGRVFKEIEFLPLSLPNQLPPPPPSVRLGKSGPPSLPPPLDKWNFDVKIITRDPVRLTGNVARGGAVADLRLTGTGARPVLTGQVKLEEAWVKLPFSRLNVRTGLITFTEAAPFDPSLTIVGDSLVGGRQVTVNVDGRALDPKVRLSSSPPLPEGEIAALLATGVTTSDLTASGDQAAGRAAFLLLSQTYRKLFKKTAARLDDEEPPRLSFEFSLFGGDTTQRGVSAVYEFSPKWRAIGRVGESGTFRGLLYYLIRFR